MRVLEDGAGFDLIGDIHGHARALTRLLHRLGYAGADGGWRHPAGRRVIFVGDYIDRGPSIPETLDIVRGVVEAGCGLALLGNHELNALRFHTTDGCGGFLRAHSPKNIAQHAATLDQFQGRDEQWRRHLAWFRTLPIWLDLGALRVVHACWDPAMETEVGEIAGPAASTERPLVERALKGVEIDLPAGVCHVDGDGTRRHKLRVRWWQAPQGATYRDLCLPQSDDLPDVPVPAAQWDAYALYPAEVPPVFFGHYCLPADPALAVARPNVCCLDLGAGHGGLLAAYRWDGEQTLDPGKLFVEPIAAPVDGRSCETSAAGY